MGEINAKGYTHPVMTYQPKFDVTTRSTSRFSANHLLIKYGSGLIRLEDVANLRTKRDNFHSTVNPQDKLDHLATSVFTVPKASSDGGEGKEVLKRNQIQQKHQKIFGREETIKEVFQVLFLVHGSSKTDIFSYQSAVQTAVVSGIGGLGKNAFITAIATKLAVASKRDSAFNIVIMKSRPSSLHSKIYFSTWRPFVLELLRMVYKIHFPAEQEENLPGGGGKSKRISGRDFELKRQDKALDVLLSMMPTEFTGLKPLLHAVLGSSDETEIAATSELFDERERLQTTCEMLIWIMSTCAKIMKKLILVVL
jgi:hypothetical protein